jgi:hypothetical protein
VLLVGASVAVGGLGCGGAAHPRRLPGASLATDKVPEVGTITTSLIPPEQGVRGDGDADNPTDIDGSGDSDSARVGGPDKDNDAPVPESYRFPDADDRATFAFGRPVGTAAGGIADLVRRYYAAAAAEDGAGACRLLVPSLARTLPAAQRGTDASARRPGETCATALAGLFARYHEELAAPIKIAHMGERGSVTQVILSSRTLRAGSIFLVRERGSWRIEEPLSRPLP